MSNREGFHSEAQDRADVIKARREAESRERTEDVFDTRANERPHLRLVPSVTCGFELNGWTCDAREHPGSDHHYFVKKESTP